MPTWIISLISVVVGGVLATGGKFILERRGVAAALAASIHENIAMVERRNYVADFEVMANELREGRGVRVDAFVPSNNSIDPIADRYLDRLGMFDGDLALKITAFYSKLMGIRLDLIRLHTGEFEGNQAAQLKIIEEDIHLWREAEKEGRDAVACLLAISKKNLWGQLWAYLRG
jgi:hypothetical protein